MKVITETTLRNFDAWAGGLDTKCEIVDHNLDKAFDAIIEELYPEGLTNSKLNDILWFDREWCYGILGIKFEEEE
jgi:hypothetical protein